MDAVVPHLLVAKLHGAGQQSPRPPLWWHNKRFPGAARLMPDTDSPRFVKVAVPVPLRSHFYYQLGRGLQVKTGSRVRVPFGRRTLIGIVTGTDAQPDIDAARIKPVIEVLDPDGDVTPSIVRLCQWASDYYQHPLGEVFSAALPNQIRKGASPGQPIELLQITPTGSAVEDGTLRRAPAQRALLALLRISPATRGELSTQAFSSQTIRTLLSKGWVAWVKQQAAPARSFQLNQVRDEGISPTPAQLALVNNIMASNQDHSTGQTFLLHGITGSGKTEVYLRAIEPILRAGKQVLVLVPEIGLTPQTINRFKNRFDVPFFVLHSSMTDIERAAGWQAAKDGSAGIILGTRSAIFTPMQSPGAIIVDEEHDTSYKQSDGFRYSARDLAVLRGQFEHIPVILGSATPSLESLQNADAGKYTMLRLDSRPPGASTETYELIDTKHLQQTDGFTRILQQHIRKTLDRGEQVLVFLNRRGFAPVMMCNDCNWIAHCKRCDARLTYHLSAQTLICHHCGAISHNLISCQSCQGKNLAAIGMGTQRVEQTLEKMFPDFPVIRIDRDTTRKKGAMESFVTEIGKGKPAILVGTQLLAKGHHFPNVTLVALLEVDSGFYSSDFRALERMGQLVLQVGGRAGRAEKPGRVLIQTAFADHPYLKLLIKGDYASFASALLEERKASQLPPYSFHALIRAEAHDPAAAKAFLELVAAGAQELPLVSLLGPVPALMEKRAGRFRQLLILTAPKRSLVHDALRQRISAAEKLPEARGVRWSVDVDPVDLF